MSKNFQELTLTGAAATSDLVGVPGVLSISGTYGTATGVVVSMTDDDSDAPYVSYTSGEGNIAKFVNAERIKVTVTGGDGSTALSAKWFPVRQPY